jgi:hypothetical protein|eukprot:3155768-Prymnesium_polylepis.1
MLPALHDLPIDQGVTRAKVVVSAVTPDITALTLNNKNGARATPQHHKLVFYDAEDIFMPQTAMRDDVDDSAC